MPKELDLHGAAQALIRLQDVYELDIAEIGRTSKLDISNKHLSPEDSSANSKSIWNFYLVILCNVVLDPESEKCKK